MLRFINIIILFFLLTGCASTSHKVTQDLTIRESCKNILLMPMDIELSSLTAGGMLEPNAEWTANAQRFVLQAINKKFAPQNIAVLSESKVSAVSLNSEEQKLRNQLVKLHEAVGNSILVHQYIPAFNLPNKNGNFDWSLGDSAKFLKEKYGTDYALFVFLRDSYATGGRVAVIVVVSALTGAVPTAGRQVGFASLVDLNTGELVWFNRLARDSGYGDLRNKEDAETSVKLLLSDFPS